MVHGHCLPSVFGIVCFQAFHNPLRTDNFFFMECVQNPVDCHTLFFTRRREPPGTDQIFHVLHGQTFDLPELLSYRVAGPAMGSLCKPSLRTRVEEQQGVVGLYAYYGKGAGGMGA